MDVTLLNSLTGFNWPALVLLVIALIGIYEHILAYNEVCEDVAAMIAAKRNGFLLEGIKADARSEITRLGAKVFLGLSYFLSLAVPGSILGRGNETAALAFLFQLCILGFLSASTQIRRRTRYRMIQKAMADKAMADKATATNQLDGVSSEHV